MSQASCTTLHDAIAGIEGRTDRQMSINPENLAALSTPDRAETRLGALEFSDGAPSPQTLAKVMTTLTSRTGSTPT